MTRVLFVCLGNICRSPAAEGVLKRMAEESDLEIYVDSCGLGDWHVGELPDARIRNAAQVRGLILSGRAKKFDENFLDHFDYILAADHEVLECLHQFAKDPQHKAKIHLMTAFGTAYKGQPIDDPYYGGDAAFEYTLDVLEDACSGLIKEIKKFQK
ncbi:MAG: low molecular weight protein-tyrosine-phosphatase [Parachlamydiaceae bacterium]